ncbi:hypothetical protein GJ744_011760 [Endocarpon pusillum]|uniref:IgE-binding protein n=1 Tax=Endocarpon pusillum TaxID=364733 RepID=A0A8H7AG12_9EURO|nr:hypothetical protein GJ744_011760 [Endocarpon pusillum]
MRLLTYILLAAPILASCVPHDPRGHDNSRRSDKHDDKQDDKSKDRPRPTSCTTTTPPASTTSCVPTTSPTKAFTVIAAHSGSPIHLLPMVAGGLGFQVGGGTSSYCPTVVGASCPPGNETVFVGGSISVMVPGGQQQYVEVGGRIGYTQAHSASMPVGAIPGGFSYYKCPDEQFGHITTSIFNATGLMACPDNSFGTQRYVVYANIPNAVVPSGNVQDCIGFDGLTSDYNGPLPAAWQYT